MSPRSLAAFLVLVVLLGPARVSAEALRDGRRFDPGATMTARAEKAPAVLDAVAPLVGQWDVEYRLHGEEDAVHVATGTAEITFMNRGHSVMEKFHCPDFNGQGDELNTLSFLAYTPAAEAWVLGVANSHTESITVFSGSMEAGGLVLRHAARRGGGAALTHYRVASSQDGPHAMSMTLEESTDYGDTWVTKVVKSYTRREEATDLFTASSDVGEAAPGLSEAAHQFDFFLGRFDEAHDLLRPQGRVQFPVNGTAVRCLNGHGILEFSWYDIDPSLPDAATSIVRIYNRQMRRWESMYITNRFNGILYFGGVMEGDRIVLHRFDADTGDSPLTRWIFHDMTADGYSWHAERSLDRGATWDEPWKIQAVRQEVP